jgi:hypothetical protein
MAQQNKTKQKQQLELDGYKCIFDIDSIEIVTQLDGLFV